MEAPDRAAGDVVIVAEPKVPDARQILGREGEAAAEEALRAAGLRIVERRFRSRQGEIDLVAMDADVLVFVEVKTRRGVSHGTPREAVHRGKQARLVRVALAYLARRRLLESRCRFDVVEVLWDASGRPRVEHIADAFRP